MVDEHTKCKGDSDPLDVCEIGTKVFVMILCIISFTCVFRYILVEV